MTRARPERDGGPVDLLGVLIADDSPDAIAQMNAWIAERWASAEFHTASNPEDAVRITQDKGLENLILDLDFGTQRDSGVAIARRILEVCRPSSKPGPAYAMRRRCRGW